MIHPKQLESQLPPGFKLEFSDTDSEEFYINLGPQHPSTHGALRLMVRLDGESVREIVPHMGYIHRGIEKQAERMSVTQYIPLTDRMDYLTSHQNNHAVCLAIEKAMNIGVPERGEYIRVMVNELQRISSHLVFMGSFGTDLGGTTTFLYAFKARELISEIFDELSGARLTMNYLRPGGSFADLPESFVPMTRKMIDETRRALDEWDQLLTGNIIFQERTRDIGFLPAERAIALGCSGPVLRGSGVSYDLRKDAPYSIYDRFQFDVPIGSKGDSWDRYIIRIEEVRQSLRILEQAIEQLPDGLWKTKEKITYRLPEGTWWGEVETAKGIWGVMIESTGKGDKPWRIKTRSPSFSNLMALDEMCRGHKIADVIAILGSIDPVIPDVDR